MICNDSSTCSQCEEPFRTVVSKKTSISTRDLQLLTGVACADFFSGCPDGTYYDNVTRTCTSCMDGCAFCLDGETCLEYCDYPCADCAG